jgi:hypothetical protein
MWPCATIFPLTLLLIKFIFKLKGKGLPERGGMGVAYSNNSSPFEMKSLINNWLAPSSHEQEALSV